MKVLSTLIGLALAISACSAPPDEAQSRTFPHDFNQVPSDALTECTDAGLLEGIDVSKYDATINWPDARDAGVVFAIARVSDGLDFPDTYFDSNWADIKSVGMIRGVYQFFEPAQNPHEQAAYLLAHIPDYGPGDLPPVIDVESLGGLDAGPAFDSVQAWVTDIHDALGVRPIIYTSARVWNEYNEPLLDADLWVANWQVSCPAIPTAWTDGGWTFWQYTATGSVSGLSAEGVDVDRFNGSLAELEVYVGGPRGFDGGGILDAGPGLDAGPIDAGSPDAGNFMDGGSDGGALDGGEFDGGPSDAGSADAGPADAGSIDAGSPPVVSLTVSTTSAKLSGIATLLATAPGADAIEIFLDGALLASGASSPFSLAWDTRQSTDGPHHLQAKAYDASGDEGVSALQTVDVDNSVFAGCAAGFILDGGTCEAPANAQPDGCTSTGQSFIGCMLVAFAFALRRKTTLRRLRKPC